MNLRTLICLAFIVAPCCAEMALGCRPELPPPGAPSSSKAMAYMAFASIPPASVDLSASMPSPLNQGSIGSCTTWATAYALKSYYEKMDHGWNIADDAQKFCPNYLYNQINGGGDNGSYVSEAIQILVQRGCTTFAAQAYSTTDYSTWPTSAQCEAAMTYRNNVVGSSTYGFILTTDLNSIKTKIAEGNPMVMVMCVDRAWDFLGSGTNYVWHPNKVNIRGWHAVAVIGYDDAMTDGNGHVGAVKIQNSWGAGWGQGGRCWASYDSLTTDSSANCLWYMADRTSYTPTIKGKITVAHAKRGDVSITCGVGSTSSPTWSYTYYSIMAQRDTTHANVDTTLDLTAAANYWPPSSSRPWWFKVSDSRSDSVTGSVTAAQMVSGASTYSSSTTLPAAIPDNSTKYVSFGASTPVVVPKPVITSATTVTSPLANAFTYRIVATNTPTSYSCGTLPSGLSLNTSTGVISGNPSAPGMTRVTVSATNLGGTASIALSITITVPAPSFTSSASAKGTVSNPFAFALKATNSPTRYTAIGLPTGLRINGVTGIISGTPTKFGIFRSQVTATNFGGTRAAFVTFTIGAYNNLTMAKMTSSAQLSCTVNSAYSTTIAALSSPTAFAIPVLPNGLSLNTATGAITGTPTASGTYNATLTVSKGAVPMYTSIVIGVNTAGLGRAVATSEEEANSASDDDG